MKNLNQLIRLKHLHLNNNNIARIEGIGNLGQLQTLNVLHNMIMGISEEVYLSKELRDDLQLFISHSRLYNNMTMKNRDEQRFFVKSTDNAAVFSIPFISFLD